MLFSNGMNHTPQIKKAIQFAARKHHGHMRVAGAQDEPLPYITHLFSVALLVAEDGVHDDVVTAALLHDAIEDTGTTREEIAEAFNEQVAELVSAVSEMRGEGGERLDWRQVKEHYLTGMERASDDAVLIVIADKIDNVEGRVEGYEQAGDAFLAHWSQPNEEYLWFYGEALRIAEARLPEHPLTKRYAQVHARQLELFAGK